MPPQRRERRAHGARAVAGLGLDLDDGADARARRGAQAPRRSAAHARRETAARTSARHRAASSSRAVLSAAMPLPSVVRSSRASCNRNAAVVARRLHVELDPARAELLRRAKARERVLGRSAAAPRWPMMRGGGSVTDQRRQLPRLLAARDAALFVELRRDVLAGRLVDLLHAQLDLAAVVEAEHLDLDLVADLDHVGHLADALRRQLADMDEPVARAEEIDEGAEIDGLHHLAGVDDAELGLGDDAADPVDRRLRRRRRRPPRP